LECFYAVGWFWFACFVGFMAIAGMTEQQFEDLFHHHPHVVKLHQLLVAFNYF
jgi:hypothetical protein